MSSPCRTIFVVDDDPSVRRTLERLLRGCGFRVCSWGSSVEFLAEHDPQPPGCIILDLAMPELDGLEVQAHLAASGCDRPIIFLTGNGDIATSVKAMQAGAVNFLTKPVEERQLLHALEDALFIDTVERCAISVRCDIEQRLATLTPRERQVLEHVVSGRLNKQIAGDLGTVEKTIKVHRARVMQKMGTRSLADLVRMASLVGIEQPASAAAAPRGALRQYLASGRLDSWTISIQAGELERRPGICAPGNSLRGGGVPIR
jgi:FixJ family two-component response regulator